MQRRDFIRLGNIAFAGTCLAGASARGGSPPVTTDVCVYGGTAAGIMAAVAARREGCRVTLVEPSRWLGGMTGGGLSHIDWGRPEAVGGFARLILKEGTDDPHYRRIFRDIVKEHGIDVVFEHRVAQVTRAGRRIAAATFDHAPPDAIGCPSAHPLAPAALTISARVFIDCSYEGDLLAKAGVSYTFGREATEHHGESLAGVRPNMAVYDIDPYLTPGDRKSGLLPFLQDLTMGPPGAADKLTMGYGFRWKFAFAGERLPLDPPDDYDPRTFELYRRAFAAKIDLSGRRMRTLGVYEQAGGRVHSPGAGNLARSLLAPVVYGSNAGYPDGEWPERSAIWKSHQNFMRGMTHFLRTDPAVPDDLRQRALKVGFQPGIFDDTAGWPHQLYVREARRMVAAYVVTQNDLAGATDPDDSVGLASYGVDDWPYATFPLDGKVSLQGGEFSMLYLDDAHRGIYKIPYRAIVPHEKECDNLLVPVCCSASHIAMTSIRMEPVWMILAESAGVAAAMAIADDLPVQTVPYPRLLTRLRELGQKLDRPA
ncbi:MAG: FAD-dependent oxidoreductase [Planctomycetes bacterium]|nr:FAD-dependent oxidoreductase [Planctomycetota bacterium]